MATQVELSDRWFLSDVLNEALAWCEADAEASACQVEHTTTKTLHEEDGVRIILIERSMSGHQICTQEMLDIRAKRMKEAVGAYEVLKDAYISAALRIQGEIDELW